MEQKRRRRLQVLCQELGLIPDTLTEEGLERMDEALTHTSSGRPQNYEQLEFLGDAVLRLAATEFIARSQPHLTVGQRSALRAQLVSDRWLAAVGREVNIERLLRVGPIAARDTAARNTLRAEATEALIGALYIATGNLDMVHHWLTPYWLRSSAALLSDPHRGNSKSALQEWSQGRQLGLPNYRCEQRSCRHGDLQRFLCQVTLGGQMLGEGWGGSRRKAEQAAARNALAQLQKKQVRDTLCQLTNYRHKPVDALRLDKT